MRKNLQTGTIFEDVDDTILYETDRLLRVSQSTVCDVRINYKCKNVVKNCF